MNPLDDQPIDHLKKQAKHLVADALTGSETACARVAAVYGDGADVGLMRAQHVVAVESGFRDWNALLKASAIDLRLVITMAKHPLLNACGIGVIEVGKRLSREERLAALARDRAELRASTTRVTHAVEWLQRNVLPTKTMHRSRDSYGFKHSAEPEIGYITNGAFIAAGMIAGYPYEIVPGSPNVSFGFSAKSMKGVDARRHYSEKLLAEAPAIARSVLSQHGLHRLALPKLMHAIVWREGDELRGLKFSSFDVRPPLVSIGVNTFEPYLAPRDWRSLGNTDVTRSHFAFAKPSGGGRQQVIVAYDEMRQGIDWIVRGASASDPSFGTGHVEDDPAVGRRTWSRHARYLWSLHRS